MAVYFKVVPRDTRLGPSGSHTLQGSDCLVFYLGGTAQQSSSHAGGVNFAMCDGSVRFAKDLDTIAAELARTPPRDVSTIILGIASQPGYATTRWQLAPGSHQAPSFGFANVGGSAVMIGLLLPAIQAAREAARTKVGTSAPLQRLKHLAGPLGHVFVIDRDDVLLRL